jgi:hypothetical protein
VAVSDIARHTHVDVTVPRSWTSVDPALRFLPYGALFPLVASGTAFNG